MRLAHLVVFNLAFAAVSAFPAVLLSEAVSASRNLTLCKGGANGFKDYVIMPGPTGVDLAGALVELPNYGVSWPFVLFRSMSVTLVGHGGERKSGA